MELLGIYGNGKAKLLKYRWEIQPVFKGIQFLIS
jgi:hypothetical protein